MPTQVEPAVLLGPSLPLTMITVVEYDLSLLEYISYWTTREQATVRWVAGL